MLAIIIVFCVVILLSKDRVVKEFFEPMGVTLSLPAASSSMFGIDPTEVSCVQFIQKYKKEWISILTDTSENGLKRRVALALLVAARGKFSSNDGEGIGLSYIDGCVIPKELNTSLSLPDSCAMTGPTKINDQSIKRTLPVLSPQGCLIDFAGTIEPSSKTMTLENFNAILDNIYYNLNKKLLDQVTSMTAEIQQNKLDMEKMRNNISALEKEKADEINLKNQCYRERDVCKSDLASKTNAYNALETSYNDISNQKNILSSSMVRYKELKPLVNLYADAWYSPQKNNAVMPVSEIGMFNQLSKTITFQLYIQNTFSNWRNIFHITNGSETLEHDLYRRPAVVISRNESVLHCIHDTTKEKNYLIIVKVPLATKMHIALVYSLRVVNVYLNGDLVESHVTEGEALPADPSDSLYISNNFHDVGGFMIRNFKIFNFAMTQDMVRTARKEDNQDSSGFVQKYTAQIEEVGGQGVSNSVTNFWIFGPNAAEFKSILKEGTVFKVLNWSAQNGSGTASSPQVTITQVDGVPGRTDDIMRVNFTPAIMMKPYTRTSFEFTV